jgi:leader peptidase (prepilin peptidase)/N-methyltransferase
MFVVLLVIDLEHGILPNRIVYPGMIMALVLSIAITVIPMVSEWELKDSIIPTLVRAIIGGGVGFLILLLPAIIYRGGMGWGDIKLAGMMGLILGFPLILVAMFFAIVSGGIVAAILLVTKKKGRRDAIPFGPFLAAAAVLTLLWGNDFLALMGF